MRKNGVWIQAFSKGRENRGGCFEGRITKFFENNNHQFSINNTDNLILDNLFKRESFNDAHIVYVKNLENLNSTC